MAIPAVLMGAVERFELVVSEEGILPIPEELRMALHLEPVEIVSLEPWCVSLHLETFSSFLGILEESVPVENQWEQVVERFLSRALTSLEERGLPIPADLFPLRRGDQLVLQVLFRGVFPDLYLHQL